MLSPATPEALAAAGVSKRFGGLVAVDDMSFTLAEREVLGLIGPNGSGKTTMMNLISGALKPSAGQISVYGHAIAGTGASNVARKGIARTFQLVRMLPTMTALENVAAGGVFGHARRWGKELDDHAHALLARVGLPSAAAMPVSALTYIDQKRVELARALASDPKILLLDEWLADFGAWMVTAQTYAASGHWPMNEKSCNNYGGCVFKGICNKDPAVREAFLWTDFEKKYWNPLEVR